MNSLGDRMKNNYENRYRIKLSRRIPVIIRLDMRCAHSLKLKKPFDEDFAKAMQFVVEGLYKEVQNCKLIYSQSDEISLLLFDNESCLTSTWFDNNLQKIDSICASLASVRFLKYCIRNSLDYINFVYKKDVGEVTGGVVTSVDEKVFCTVRDVYLDNTSWDVTENAVSGFQQSGEYTQPCLIVV